MLGTLGKAAEVLDLFTPERPEWGVTEVAKALSWPKSSAHAILNSLAQAGFLHRTPGGRYRLGWRILVLARTLNQCTPLKSLARPILEKLVATYGETVHLAVLERGKVLYVDKMQGTRAVRVEITGEGALLWPHGSALGKVLLAHLPEEEVRDLFALQGLPRLTPNTITTLDELLSELEGVRRRGYAYDIEEYMPELCCVAAPVRNHAGAVVAALSFSVPAYRFHSAKVAYRNVVMEAAQRISELLGYDPALLREEKVWARRSR